MQTDLVVVGAGPAGLAAAIAAKKAGVERVLVIERDSEAGGILNQCIHSGFGLSYFNLELTGPEYATRFIEQAMDIGIEFLFDTMVLSVATNMVRALNANDGNIYVECKAVVLAMGCRERTRFAIAIPGTRPSGVMTAGLAQRYINIEGKIIGKRVIILGSGDIGLIMARRLTLEGAEVLACVEIMPYSSGLSRNISQCLDDFEIPLLLSHTVTEIHGKRRLVGVTISQVDENRRIIEGTDRYIECDTLLLSVGLIPENELSSDAGILLDDVTKGPIVNDYNETSQRGVFASGNVLQVHDLVDFVSLEAERTGRAAAKYILDFVSSTDANRRVCNADQSEQQPEIHTIAKENISYLLPQRIVLEDHGDVDIFFRVKQPIRKGIVVVYCGDKELLRLSKEYLAPGEMQLINLNKQDITDDISVEVEVLR